MRIVMSGFVVLLCIAGSSPADETAPAELSASLKILNQAFIDRDAAAIQRLMTDDHLAVTTWGGVQTRDAQVKTLPELKLSKYMTGPLQWTKLGADVMLVSYPLTMAGTFGARELPAQSRAVAVWILRNGTWKEAHYQETPLPSK